ncbi:hypothetical protein E2C01_010878 [Portunus trituberculatus]|uniref:Uncharacterized protein n=1 Tax=Portunus trituberculatus TaxID=210409 RepID=A0A5B7D9T5_PORTR|nr:hypothetical protein [Portunus trituberculatus]
MGEPVCIKDHGWGECISLQGERARPQVDRSGEGETMWRDGCKVPALQQRIFLLVQGLGLY